MIDVPPAAINPWIDMWLKPRATMRFILDTDPRRMVIVLAMIGGVARTLDRASSQSLGDRFPLAGVLAFAAIFGALSGMIGLYLFGFLVRWTGGWIGGRGTAEGIRAALAWPNVITAWALLLMIPELFIFREELFTSATPRIEANPLLSLGLMVFGAQEIVCGLWAVVATLKCLGEVQGFSAWRALGNTLLAGLVIAAPFLVLAILVIALR